MLGNLPPGLLLAATAVRKVVVAGGSRVTAGAECGSSAAVAVCRRAAPAAMDRCRSGTSAACWGQCCGSRVVAGCRSRVQPLFATVPDIAAAQWASASMVGPNKNLGLPAETCRAAVVAGRDGMAARADGGRIESHYSVT
ncbi:hypothetical protein SASPL_143051 [Salvia splendens]|uniref:Uncharacterized protein n=1 Tax=Salvia splendens TaxID=180675 RepID=A0A8X8WKV6_SALSN|nr:hypothetical protein SASPL_143051 [Salvia splendens]